MSQDNTPAVTSCTTELDQGNTLAVTSCIAELDQGNTVTCSTEDLDQGNHHKIVSPLGEGQFDNDEQQQAVALLPGDEKAVALLPGQLDQATQQALLSPPGAGCVDQGNQQVAVPDIGDGPSNQDKRQTAGFVFPCEIQQRILCHLDDLRHIAAVMLVCRDWWAAGASLPIWTTATVTLTDASHGLPSYAHHVHVTDRGAVGLVQSLQTWSDRVVVGPPAAESLAVDGTHCLQAPDLPLLVCLPSLKKLRIKGTSMPGRDLLLRRTHLQPLVQALPMLEALHIEKYTVLPTTATFVTVFTNLKSLHCDAPDFAGALAMMHQTARLPVSLEHLSLTGISRGHDFPCLYLPFLTNMRSLDLPGKVDAEVTIITQLARLTHLNLSYTDISVEGVCQLSRLTQMESLDLYNRFREVPVRAMQALRSLTRLQSLNLNHMDVSSLAWQQVGSLSSLRTLLVSLGYLTSESVSALAQLTNLVHLDIGYATAPDWSTTSWALITQLTSLHFVPSMGVGFEKMPTTFFAGLTDLQNLYMHKITLLPTSDFLLVASGLRSLQLARVKMDEACLVGLSQLTALTLLNLSCTCPAFTFHSRLSTLTNLEELETSGRESLSPDCVHLSSLHAAPRLRILHLSYSDLPDNAIQQIALLTSLQMLDMKSVKIKAEGHPWDPLGENYRKRAEQSAPVDLEPLRSLVRLRDLDVSETFLAPSSLWALTQAKSLDVLKMTGINWVKLGLARVVEELDKMSHLTVLKDAAKYDSDFDDSCTDSSDDSSDDGDDDYSDIPEIGEADEVPAAEGQAADVNEVGDFPEVISLLSDDSD